MLQHEFRAWLKTVPTEDLQWIVDRVREERDRRDICEHGVATGDWCKLCNREHKRAAAAYEKETSSHD